MNRERFLLVLGADAKKWASRYGIEPFSLPCSVCGIDMKTVIPFAFKAFRGLLAEHCSCGNTDAPYCLVRKPGCGDLFTGTD